MEESLNQLITGHSIFVMGNSNELETQLTLNIIKNAGASYHLLDMSHEDDKESWINAVESRTGKNQLPLIFIAGEFLGGYFELKTLDKDDELIPRLCGYGIPNNAMPEGDPDININVGNNNNAEYESFGGLFD